MPTAAGARYAGLEVTIASATRIGGRSANADAVSTHLNPLGAGAAVVDGIGTTAEVVAAARVAADAAGIVASHRGAQAGILAAADTMPDYPGAPNAVAVVASIDAFGRIELAHVGDAAAWTWSPASGLVRQTADETVGQHIAYMLTNPSISQADRSTLERLSAPVVAALDDYVLGTLARASVSTISWTPLRGEYAEVDVIVLTSDGVHKALSAADIAGLVQSLSSDGQALAEALVDATVEVGDGSAELADNATAAVLALRHA